MSLPVTLVMFITVEKKTLFIGESKRTKQIITNNEQTTINMTNNKQTKQTTTNIFKVNRKVNIMVIFCYELMNE